MWLLGNQFVLWVLEAAEGAKHHTINQGGKGSSDMLKTGHPPEGQIVTGFR